MNDKEQVHDIFSRFYGKRKAENRGVKKGSVRGKYKSHMKKQLLSQKKEKERIRQQKHRQKQKTPSNSIKCHAFLKEGGMLIPNIEDNAHSSQQQRPESAETEASHGISLITRMTRYSKK